MRIVRKGRIERQRKEWLRAFTCLPHTLPYIYIRVITRLQKTLINMLK